MKIPDKKSVERERSKDAGRVTIQGVIGMPSGDDRNPGRNPNPEPLVKNYGFGPSEENLQSLDELEREIGRKNAEVYGFHNPNESYVAVSTAIENWREN